MSVPPGRSRTDERRTERLSTYTAGIGVPVLRAGDTPLQSLPNVTQRRRYAWAYWGAMIRNLTGSHGLRPEATQSCAAPMTVTPELRRRWQALFNATGDAGEPDVPVPYLYNQSVGTLLYTQLIGGMGINFRHLLHVQHETKHWATVDDWVRAEHQELHASLRGAWRLGEGKALIALRIAIHRRHQDGGALLGTVNDRFIIRNVPTAQLEALPTGRSLLRNLAELRRKEPQLDPTTANSARGCIHLSSQMGRQFGSVSGDFNPVHTTRFVARAFGVKRPFLQGLGLRNAMIRQLALHGRPLTRFNISFASPAYLDQTLQVVMQGPDFEVVDELGQVVAFGAGALEA